MNESDLVIILVSILGCITGSFVAAKGMIETDLRERVEPPVIRIDDELCRLKREAVQRGEHIVP